MVESRKDWKEGLLTVSRIKNGKAEIISGLMTMEITKDGPNLSVIDEINGEPEPSASATMLWREIENVKFEEL